MQPQPYTLLNTIGVDTAALNDTLVSLLPQELRNVLDEKKYVMLRQIVSDSKLKFFLAKFAPDSLLLEYNDSTSPDYQTITQWCNLSTDLVSSSYGMLATKNGICYSTHKAAFVQLDFEHFIEIGVDVLLQKTFPMFKIKDHSGEFLTFIEEWKLPEQYLEKLVQEQIITLERIKIAARALATL